MMPRSERADSPVLPSRWWRAVLLIAAAAVVGGCASPPTTTYTDASGETVTVDWSDYPADPYTDIDDVLALPTAEEVDQRWAAVRAAVIAAIESELAGEFGDLEWRSRGDDGWHPYGGNGYGGQTMLEVYNSAGWEAEVSLPEEAWPRVIDAAERELASWGIDGAGDLAGPGDPDTSEWLLVGDFFQHGEFMSVSVQDAREDEQALKDAEQYDHLISGITLFYGIQTISREDEDAFIRAAAPFEGLTRPEPTHSD
ncbi:MAG: LppA family lipoprotein [Microbacterium sp.]